MSTLMVRMVRMVRMVLMVLMVRMVHSFSSFRSLNIPLCSLQNEWHRERNVEREKKQSCNQFLKALSIVGDEIREDCSHPFEKNHCRSIVSNSFVSSLLN